jgi:hypothetical protein
MFDLNFTRGTADGSIDVNQARILASTGTYDYCAFAARDDPSQPQLQRWLE